MSGLQGSGKTTFSGKLANMLKTKKGKKPLLVACDVYRPMLLEISANVQGIKKALIAKDFIDMDGDTVSFNDPFFKQWIRRNIEQL